MAKYFEISVGGIFLTKNGLTGGTRYKTSITGLDKLIKNKTGNIQPSADGTPHLMIVQNNQKNIIIGISVPVVRVADFEAINDLCNEAVDNPANIALVISGTPQSHNLTVKPALPDWVEYPGTFHGNFVKGVVYRFVTT